MNQKDEIRKNRTRTNLFVYTEENCDENFHRRTTRKHYVTNVKKKKKVDF